MRRRGHGTTAVALGAALVVAAALTTTVAAAGHADRSADRADAATAAAASEALLASAPFDAARMALHAYALSPGVAAKQAVADATLALKHVVRVSSACDCDTAGLTDDPANTPFLFTFADRDVVVYDRTSGRRLASVQYAAASGLDTSYAAASDFDPHTGILAVANNDGTTEVVKLAPSTGQPSGPFTTIGSATNARPLDLAIDDQRITEIDSHGGLQQWTASGTRWQDPTSVQLVNGVGAPLRFTVATLTAPTGGADTPKVIGISSRGEVWATGDYHPNNRGQVRPSLVRFVAGAPREVDTSTVPFGSPVAVIVTTQGITLFDTAIWSILSVPNLPPENVDISAASFSQDGSYLVTAASDGVRVSPVTPGVSTSLPSGVLVGGAVGDVATMDAQHRVWILTDQVRLVEIDANATSPGIDNVLPPATALAFASTGLFTAETTPTINVTSPTFVPDAPVADKQPDFTAINGGFVQSAVADATHLAVGGRDAAGVGTVWLYETTTGKLLRTLHLSAGGDTGVTAPPDLVTRVRLGPSGALAATDAAGDLALWDAHGTPVFTRKESGISAFAFSRTQPHLVVLRVTVDSTSTPTAAIDELDARSGHLVRTRSLAERVLVAALSPDAASVAISDGRGRVTVIDTISGEPTGRVDEPEIAVTLAYSPNGRQLAVGLTGGHVAFLTRKVDDTTAPELSTPGSTPLGLIWSEDGSRIATLTGRAATDYFEAQAPHIYSLTAVSSPAVLCHILRDGVPPPGPALDHGPLPACG
ncbi:MAG: hypothetical protein JO079_08115 [Frankiaceae bacterium]|nr:hypothetical protein [Frankiaceae bacterium]